MASPFKFILVAFVLLQAKTCKKEDFAGIPPCLSEKIQQTKSEEVANPPSSIWQYEYNGKTVYYIPAKCCDIPSSLFDSDCNLICQPDGGFSGKGDGKCKDFFEKRTKGRLVWRDNRK